VVKANPGHSRLSAATAEVVNEVISANDAPAGVFGIVYGFEVGQRLVSDQRIAAAAFTGSLAGGRALFDRASARESPIPFYGELGSTNPAFLTRGAAGRRLDEVVSGFISSLSLGVGQFCTKPGFLFVPEDLDLDDAVTRAVEAVPAASMLGDRIRENFDRTLDSLATTPGVRIVARGTALEGSTAPTILATTAAIVLGDRENLMRECFGPTAMLVSYRDDDQLLTLARAFDGQLTGSVFAEDGEPVGVQLVQELARRVGRVLWNNWPTGVSVTHAMQHGGPYPATTAPGFTSVGTASIDRFLRPVAYQNTPTNALPIDLLDENPLRVPQRIDGELRLS
jgi:NADP-dependent aldehyde dehydrogenase